MSTESYRWHYDYSRIAWDTGFCFNNQKSQKTFDRNGIALLDIERIIRERDIGIVEHHIQNILEYNLDSEEARILDPNFVKLFRLSQLAVEYLIYCKKYLDSTVTTIKKDLQQYSDENDDLKHDLGYYQSEVHKLKKKVRDLKSTLQIVQKYKPIGISSEEIGTFQCNECNKLFVNLDYLRAHILRRHPNNDIDVENVKNIENHINNSPIHTQYKAETDRLQMEIKSLKEKLNNTERFFQNEETKNKQLENSAMQNSEDKKSEEYYKGIEKLHEQFELLKTQIESELHTLKEQKNDQTKYDKMMEQLITKLDEKSSIEKRTEQTAPQVHKENYDKEIQVDIHVEQIKESPQVDKIVTTTEQKFETEKIVKKASPSPKKQSIGPKLRESPTRFIKVSESPTKLLMTSIDTTDSSTKIETTTTAQNTLTDISRVKEEVGKELEEKTKKNMEKLSEEITEKMSETFGKLQGQLETFWSKLQDFEIEREKQKLESKSETKQIKIEPKILNLPKESESKYHMRSIEIDADSDTESSKQEIIQKPSKLSFSMKPIHQTEKDTKNLISELKAKVQQRNITKVQEKIEEPKTNVSHALSQSMFSKTIEYSSETESSSESEETESDSESETPIVDTKPSKTLSHQTEATRPTTTGTGISTLQNRSIRSLENALHDNPEILEIFKNDLNEVVSNRLKDLGIDPEWTRIPEKTFELKSDIITHERNMAVKNIKSFLDIRQNIIDKLEEKITGLKSKETIDLSPEPETRTSKFKSIFTQMRNKAKSIIKSEKPVQNLNQTPNKSIYQLTVHKNAQSTKQKETEANPKSNTQTKKLIKRKQEVLYTAKPIIYETDSDSQVSAEVEEQPPKPTESSKKLLRKSRSDSSMEILEISDVSSDQKINQTNQNIPVAAARSMDSILEMKTELKAQLNKSIENMNSTVETIDIMDYKDDVNVESNNNNKRKIVKSEYTKIELENMSTDSSDDSMEYEKTQKSVLKHSTIVGATKKRVLFDLHSEEKTPELNESEKETKIINPNIVKKTLVKSNTTKSEWNDSSSLDSSIFEFNKKELKDNSKGKDIISTKAIINVSKKNEVDDDLSDFVISDIN